jgi:vacuolar-type H+-ATPase catalytic subunit A/Vma1
MKKYFFILLLLADMHIYAQHAPLTTAVAYNDFIVAEQAKISEKILDFSNNFYKDSLIINAKYEALKFQCLDSYSAIKSMPAFDNSTAYRDVAANLFQFYVNTCSDEYAKFKAIAIRAVFNEDDMKMIGFLIQSLTLKEQEYDLEFTQAQTQFAADNNFQLNDNPMQEKLDKQGNE